MYVFTCTTLSVQVKLYGQKFFLKIFKKVLTTMPDYAILYTERGKENPNKPERD